MSKIKIIIVSLASLIILLILGAYLFVGKDFEKMPTIEMPAGSIVPASSLLAKNSTSTPITTPGSTCLNFTVDMQYGDSDSKEFKGIATLQKYLQEKG